LLQVGNFIYTGWASHCIQYNYTGAIIGFDKTSGAIIEAYAMQGGQEPNTVPGGGVWMSGGGLAYDGGSLYFSTGNGYAAQLPATGNPVNGRNPPTALEEAVVNMRIESDGKLKPVDFFMPWEKTQLDGADKDLGTSPFQLLPSTFSCPNSRRIGMVTGKSGKTYWLNVDNLGGYQQGADRLDAAIQVFQHENSVYSAAGVQPLGGYIYVNVINYKTRVFQFSCNPNGDAKFTEVTTAAEKNAQALGVGHGTTTSLNGQAGTGLYWTTDVDGMDLRIYDATPPSDGSPLKLIKGFNIDGPGKFAHPVFGDGRAYVGARGALWAFGAPVNLPLNCTSPVAFPRTAINSTSDPLTVNCIAKVATSVTSFNLTGNPNFVASGLPTLPLTLAAGQSFSFQAQFAPKTVGFLSSDIAINTTNAAAGSASRTPVTLTGTASSASALFGIQPITLTFNTTLGAGAVSKSVFWNNDGDATLNVNSVQYSVVSEQGPWITPNTTADGSSQVAQFTFSNVPASIDPNSRQSIGVIYDPATAGNHAVFVKVATTGGTKILDVFGTAGSSPVALYEFQRPDGSGWDVYVPGKNFSFGNVTPGTVRTLTLRITNNGSNTASPLGLTVSKPPFSVPGYLRASNSIDLAEGTVIPAGQSANATLYCAPDEAQLNTPSTQASAAWRINTNNDQGAVILGFVCNGVSPQVGPLYSNGTAVNSYIGCYKDFTPNRQMAALNYVNTANNTAQTCISKCNAAGFTFSALIYRTECWCGNTLPAYRVTDDDCNYRCSGDPDHDCGGNGVAHNGNMISLFADTTKWDGVLQGPPVILPRTSGNYGFFGCYQENNARTFSQKVQNSLNQTVENCRTFCAGYPFFGLQYSAECYCGSTMATSSTQIADRLCDNTCKGNNSVVCGGGQKMQVYKLNYTPSSTSTTTTVSATSTSAQSATSTAAPLKCPGSNGQTYTSGLKTFIVDCGTDYQGGDIKQVNVANGNINQCIDACAVTDRCVGAVLNGVACYLKSDTSRPSALDYEVGVRLVSTAPSPSTTTTATTLTFTTSSSSTPSSTPLSCPGSDKQQYTSGQMTFTVECGTDYQGGDLETVTVDVNNVNQCADTCSSTLGCSGAVLSGDACYLKSDTSRPVAAAGVVGLRSVPQSSSTTTATGTDVATSSATSASSTPSSGPLTCPASGGSTYVSNQQTFVVDCGVDYQGGDLQTVNVADNDLNGCLDACSSTTGCQGAVVYGAACYLKSDTSRPKTSSGLSAGRIVVASSTTTTSTVSTTASGGSTSGASTTSASSTTTISSTTSSATPSQTPLQCPGSDGQTYTSNGQTFLIECGRDYPGNDIGSVAVKDNDLNACIDACAKKSGCINVSLLGAGCYLKNKLGNAVSNSVWGARVVPNVSSSTTTTSSVVSSTTSSSASSSAASSTTSSAASTTASSTISTTASSSAASSTATSAASSSVTSTTTSSVTSSSTTSAAPSTTTTLSTTTSTLSTTPSSTTPSQTTTTSFVTSTITTTTRASTTTTTKSSTTTSSRPTVQPTAGIYYSVGCTSEKPNGRALTEVYTNSTLMTVDMCATEAKRRQFAFAGVQSGKECWMGDILDSQASPLSQDKCLAVCPGDKTVSCGGSRAFQLYQVNTTLIEPKSASPSPLACPAADDTVYTAPNGAKYRIECGCDRTGGSSTLVTAATYEACLNSCSTTTDCKSVSLSGKNCYLKTGTLGTTIVRKDSVRGATLLKNQ
jgi:hypothetical protein